MTDFGELTVSAGDEVFVVPLPDGKQSMTMFYAGVHFATAVEACERMRGGNPRTADSIVAIMSASAACEAFISELAYEAGQEVEVLKREGQRNSVLESFSMVMLEDGVSGNMSICTRYDVAKLLLSGSPYDHGAQLFQDFSFLTKLRNELAHIKPRAVGTAATDKGIIAGLRSRNLITDPHPSLLGNLMNFDVARFACNSASAIIRDLDTSCHFPERRCGRYLFRSQSPKPGETSLDGRFPLVT